MTNILSILTRLEIFLLTITPSTVESICGLCEQRSASHLSEGALAEDLEEAELLEADLLAAALSLHQFLQGGFA